MVQLFEKGYGKDAAGIAMEAIAFGTAQRKCGGACVGPIAPWVSLGLAESQGYPPTNLLLDDESGLGTYPAKQCSVLGNRRQNAGKTNNSHQRNLWSPVAIFS